MPEKDSIDLAGKNLKGGVHIPSMYPPGPMEGDMRIEEIPGRRVEGEKDEATFLEIIEKSEKPIPIMVNISQHLYLSGGILTAIRKVIKDMDLESDVSNRLYWLMDACLVAAPHRDIEMATLIANKSIEVVRLIKSDEDVSSIINILLLASASIKDNQEWKSWLSDYFSRAANRIHNSYANSMLKNFREIKTVTPQIYSLTSRAEAILLSSI